MVEETGELWHSPVGSGAWRPVQVDQDHMAQGMRESSWSRGFTAFSGAIVEAMRSGKEAFEMPRLLKMDTALNWCSTRRAPQMKVGVGCLFSSSVTTHITNLAFWKRFELCALSFVLSGEGLGLICIMGTKHQSTKLTSTKSASASTLAAPLPTLFLRRTASFTSLNFPPPLPIHHSRSLRWSKANLQRHWC